ncbi:RNA-directed DNA polymerase, eukaryota, reverse transcriptase zinc-binding domain protein [Tanacetum coccineum]
MLKGHIRQWVKGKKDNATSLRKELKTKLAAIDTLIDKGVSSFTHLEDCLDIMNHLSSLDNTESIELAQKAKVKWSIELAQNAKVKWSIEGDENSKFFHGIINKRRNNLAIRGTIIDGEWIEDPIAVKNEFLSHFQSRFEAPCANRLVLDMVFPNRLSPEQAQDLERVFVKEEIKEAVWDCVCATSIYYMSMYKAHMYVINKLEAIRSHFFNDGDPNIRKMTFLNGKTSWLLRIWVAIHGVDGKLGYHIKPSASSNWIDIVCTLSILLNKGIDLLGYIKKKVDNGEKTLFWYEPWKGDVSFNNLFPRLFALELDKKISVAGKMAQPSLITSFRRNPRSGTEASQMAMLTSLLEGICLPNMLDRWCWSLSGDEEFSVSSARILIDDKTLGTVGSKTHWCKYVPLKVNILSWRVKLNNLPTRLNLSRRGMDIQSILCPSCNLAVESTNHIFFSCPMMKDLYKSISRWWDVNLLNLSSYDDWWEWFSSLRLSSKLKLLMEGVFYITWWSVWNFRNKSIFGPFPSKARLFDDIVALSFTWCRSRSKLNFSKIDWLKNPLYISM